MRKKQKNKIFSRLLLTTLTLSMCMGSITAFADPIYTKDVQLVTTPSTENVEVKDGKFTLENVLYQTYNEEDDAKRHLGEVMIDGVSYSAVSVTEPKYVRKDSISPETITYVSEVWTGDGEEQKPANTMEQDGVTFKLKNLYKEENKSQERTEVKDATVAYVAIEDSVSIPEEKEITFTDKDTKQEVTAMLPLKSETVKNEYWDDSFQFDITISGYNADTYMLGDLEIPASANLLDYKENFIKLLALNPEKYEITSIDWNGGQYNEEGLVKRKAIGKGRKYVQDIDAVYSGEVTLPETIGYVWMADYAEDIPDNKSVVYTMAVNAEYAPTISSANEGGFLSKALEAIIGVITAAYTALAASFKEHPVVTSIPFVIFAGLVAFLITRKIRHRCIYNNSIKCPYGKRNKETCKSCPNFYKRSAAPRKEFVFGKKEEEE